MNIVIVGYSTFSWELAMQLKDEIRGRLYYVLPDPEKAMDASLEGNIVAIRGEITDTAVLDQLDLLDCHTFVAGAREDEANVLSALYAKNEGAQHVYARIFDTGLAPLLESLGVVPIQTSHTAAASTAIRILKPAVSELVSLTRGQFALEEIEVKEYPELIGCRLGNLQGEHLHIIAVAQGGRTWLSYNTVVQRDATFIIIYDKAIRKGLRHELRRVATQAARRVDEGGDASLSVHRSEKGRPGEHPL
jgi:Trk K+ transport system NAD-binding subunit